MHTQTLGDPRGHHAIAPWHTPWRPLAPWGLAAAAHGALVWALLAADGQTPAALTTPPSIQWVNAVAAPAATTPPARQTPPPRPAPPPRSATTAAPALTPPPTPSLAPSTTPAPTVTRASEPDTARSENTASAPAAAPAADTPAAPATPVVAARFDADYLHNPPPAYPSLSRRLGEEGRVLLRAHVLPDGRADSVEIKQSSGSPRLDAAALDTVRRWRFVPARQGNDSVPSWVLVPIAFRLEN